MMQGLSTRFPVISVLAATSLWGTSGPAQALAHTGANPAAGPLAVLVLSEHLDPPAIAGALRLLAGVALASQQPLRQPVAAQALVETLR
jgi:drug/metabolite transporter (DMT)-like permease